MRINRLTIAGFGPYKTAQHIDFDAFADDGIFLITGNTGAGKSSILDAICFALYASVPRYEGTQQQLRSDHCEPGDPTYVELWFSTGGQNYRVRRSPDYEQPKKRGEGTTKRPAAAELFIRVGEASADQLIDEVEWQGIAAIPREVGIALDGILGLSKDQFLQVILLAQNRFQKFLHAKNDERQGVLQSLFGTRRFADIERALVERRKALEVLRRESAEQIAQLGSQVEAILGAGLRDETVVSAEPGAADRQYFESALAELTEQLDAAQVRVAAADARFAEAEAELRERENIRRLQARRDEAAARLDELQQAEETIEDERRRLEAATRAEIVWAHVTAENAAESALHRAVADEKAARTAYDEATALSSLSVGSLNSPSAEVPEVSSVDEASAESDVASTRTIPHALASTAAEINRLLGGLDVILADEKRVPQLDKRIAEYDGIEARQQIELAAAAKRAVSLPAQIDEALEKRNASLLEASGRSDADERVERLRIARQSAELAAVLKSEVDDARMVEKAKSTENTEAAALYDQLLTRRLDGHAAELASTLVDGEPCVVCGSTEHPNPTAWTSDLGEPVSDDQIDSQRAHLARASEALTEAGLTVRDLVARHASAEASAGAQSPAEIDEQLKGAQLALSAVVAAEASARELDAQIVDLRAELESITTTVAELTEGVQSTNTARAALVSQRTQIVELVEKHRGDHSTVAERVLELQHLFAVTRDFEEALLAHNDKHTALEAARQTLRQHLDEQGFADRAEAVELRLTSAQRADAASRIGAHDVAHATALNVLAEPDLQGLVVEAVEVESAAEAREAASSDRDDARVAAGSAADRLSRLRAIVGDALEQLGASEGLLAEYETMRSLANTVEGAEPNTMRMRLESYVLAAQLEEIIRAANARLAVMTGGRYSLEHDDSVQYRNTRSGLGIAILDQHTGRARATHSLSGGETFLASLALALGLAEVVSNQAGGITLDTLFIDEGFGSLDADTLAIAMSTLDSLRSGGRTIGLISHVEAMKEQIPSRLRITVTPQGFSEIDQRS